VGDLRAVEQACAFCAGDGSDGHAVDDAGDELANALGVGQAGHCGAVCDLSGAGDVFFAHLFLAQWLGYVEVGLAADLDGQVGYGVHAGDPAHLLE